MPACLPPPRKQCAHQSSAALRLGGRRAQQTAKDARKDAGHSESEDEGGDEGIRRVEPGAAAAAAASAANAATAAANLAVRRQVTAPCARRWLWAHVKGVAAVVGLTLNQLLRPSAKGDCCARGSLVRGRRGLPSRARTINWLLAGARRPSRSAYPRLANQGRPHAQAPACPLSIP